MDVVATLAILLLASNAFWAWQTHRLVNKLMSRNYFEFKEAGLSAEKLKGKIKTQPQEVQALTHDELGAVSELF